MAKMVIIKQQLSSLKGVPTGRFPNMANMVITKKQLSTVSSNNIFRILLAVTRTNALANVIFFVFGGGRGLSGFRCSKSCACF